MKYIIKSYFLCIFIICSITWALLTGPSPSSIWTDGSQQPWLQSGTEACQCRKATAAALHTHALHSHSCTFRQTALHKGVGAASSARCYSFLRDPSLSNGLDWKEMTSVETAFFPFPLTSPHLSPLSEVEWHFRTGSPTHWSLYLQWIRVKWKSQVGLKVTSSQSEVCRHDVHAIFHSGSFPF